MSTNPYPNTDKPIMKQWSLVQRARPLLEMSPIETRIVGLLAANMCKWDNSENHPLSVGMALELNVPERTARHGLRTLDRRGWIVRGVNYKGRHSAHLSKEFIEVCDEALWQQRVRRYVGSTVWTRLQEYKTDEDLYSIICTQASKMTNGWKFAKCIQVTAIELESELRQRGPTVVPLDSRRKPEPAADIASNLDATSRQTLTRSLPRK